MQKERRKLVAVWWWIAWNNAIPLNDFEKRARVNFILTDLCNYVDIKG